MSSTDSTNYAREFGIQSVAAAVIFAVAYAILLGVFVWKSFRRPTHVYYALVFFCTSMFHLGQ